MPNTTTRIIHIAQGETARTTEPDVALLTSKVQNCIVVIFIGIWDFDGKPYRSMTHVDFKTAPNFLGREVNRLKPNFKILIVKNGEYNSNLLDRIVGRVKHEKEEGNYQFTFQEIEVFGGSLWLKGEKVLSCSEDDFKQFSTGQWKAKGFLNRLWNPENVCLEEGNRSVQLRHHQRSFLCMLHSSETLPSVVFDDVWTDDFEKIPDKIQLMLNDLRVEAKSEATRPQIRLLVRYGRPGAQALNGEAMAFGHDQALVRNYYSQLDLDTMPVVIRMRDYNTLLDKQEKVVNDSAAASAGSVPTSAEAESKSDSDQPSPMMTPVFSASTSASLRNRTGALAEHTAAAPESSAMAPGSEPSAAAEAAPVLPKPEDREQKPRKKKCCRGSCVIL